MFALCCAVVPASANAGSLLSGYGGPGQGNQAILGSTLLNGPSAGSGGGSGPAGGASAVGGAPGADGSRVGGKTGGATRLPAAASRKHTGAAHNQGPTGAASTGSGGPVGAAAGTATVRSQALGMSTDDLLYIFIAFAALAITAALTRQFTRQSHGGTKAMASRTRESK